jgi:hypothetical protein
MDLAMACRNTKRYLEFRTQHGFIPPFMTAVNRLWLPMLHADDSEMIAITSLNTGLLDYHTGEPCMNFDVGIPTVIHQPGLLANFRDGNYVSRYCEVLSTLEARRNGKVAPWLFCTEEEFEAIPVVKTSNKLKRNLEEYESNGGNTNDLVPKSKPLGPPPPKRQRLEDKDSTQRHSSQPRPYRNFDHYEPKKTNGHIPPPRRFDEKKK